MSASGEDALKSGEDTLKIGFYEMANVRDQCSWAHWHDKYGAAEKAKKLVKSEVS